MAHRSTPTPHVATILLTLTGCYGAAPPRPAPVALPEIQPGARLSVYSEATTEYEDVQRQSETCPNGHGSGSTACVKTTYTVKEPVTRTRSTATYGEQPIDYAQFKVLADPAYSHKLMALDDHSEACEEANVPRWIGMGLALGGAAAYLFSGGNTTVQTVGLVGLGGGAGSYTAGYFMFGGRRCNEAASLYHQVNHAPDQGVNEVWGSVTATEMKSLSEDFNRRISPVVTR